MRQRDYYEVLGLDEDSPQEEIAERYRQLADFLAPDSLDDELNPWAERQLALIEEAYAVLGDSTRRQEYDLRRSGLASAASSPGASLRGSATAGQRRQTVPKAVARPGTGWWRRGPVPMAIGGFLLGVVILLVIVAGTGNWDRVSGLFGASSGDTTSQATLVDAKRVAGLEAAIQQNPADVEALFELGEIYVAAEDWAMAIYWHGRVLEVDSSNTHSLNDVALANFYLGRNTEAQATWDRALELDPNDPILHYSLAFFLLNSPPYDWGQARVHFQKVVELAPESDTAQSALSHIEAIDTTLANATPEVGGEKGP